MIKKKVDAEHPQQRSRMRSIVYSETKQLWTYVAIVFVWLCPCVSSHTTVLINLPLHSETFSLDYSPESTRLRLGTLEGCCQHPSSLGLLETILSVRKLMFKMGNERKFKKPWSLAEFLKVFLFHHAVLVYVFFYHMLVSWFTVGWWSRRWLKKLVSGLQGSCFQFTSTVLGSFSLIRLSMCRRAADV